MISSPSLCTIALFTLLAVLNDVAMAQHEYIDRERFRENPTRGYKHEVHPCDQRSCYPQTGNLLIGREDQLSTSSTCGVKEPQRYCIVSHLEDRKKCFWCDSRPTKVPKPALNHNISNLVHRLYPGTRQKSWWQSENGKENAFIQLDLEAEFHFTHLIITFKTFRPAAMLIERSYDFQKSWQVYRYFAHNCNESFPGVKTDEPQHLTDVVCESRYSSVDPSTGGEVIYRVLLPNLHIDNPFSPQVQNLVKVTNLRINFTKLHTLGDDLLDRREEIQEKYYYGITNMVVRGSCSCYGHANYCMPLPNIDPNPDMVHGRCQCTHNTKGRNCEKCEDFYNDRPWRPAVGSQPNACKKCNCNNHASSCHFDPAVYEASKHVSGGVCDGCKHNTMGTNCEQCKPFYYRDPDRDIQDPEVCRPCDCDPHGSLENGICDSATDADNNLISGSCHCKTNVMGRRCDACKNGYWDFNAENPDGCRPCTCNTFGTIDNQGCNVYTGECTCKRYVTGRDCNQCLPEFYGLSENERDGCRSCDCDPGGSVDNHCDVISGQCKCRDQMTGRTCDTPQQQHYTASLDFLLYEAEFAKGSPTCQVVIREPYRDGRPDTWTGAGFMKAFEDSYLEFDVDDILTTMEYDIVVRYEPTSPDLWDNVEMRVIRPDEEISLGKESACHGTDPNDDLKTITLASNSRSATAYPPTCMESNKRYKIRLDFKRSRYNKDSPPASILIDSIVLIPRIETIPWFHGSPPAEARRKEYERQCTPTYELQNGQISNVCKKYYNSIGAYIFKGAFNCQCDPTGSTSKLCDSFGGSCSCKRNVVGRRCDRCAPGTFGFGPEGCKSCDCNSIGALDNFCNATTGQCKCRSNTYGRECDQCRTGFWNFPNCLRCDCNGHADLCESKTGVCVNCRDYTEGYACERCVNGYYGDPRLNVDIPCRQCPCPETVAVGHSFADKCYLDATSKGVICECNEGYAGAKCDMCADNYYGHPELPDGSCTPCDCNNKVDLLKTGNCDPHTGVCLQCLFETSGKHCETCKPDFYRTHPDEMCKKCDCHLLGSNSSSFCDPNSGQCPCLPFVEGRDCDQCAQNYWKIASGSGCETCNCDPVGSLYPQCNLFDGQCHCKPNYGGRQCNECKENHWGNPKANECKECRCDIYGSETMQCDRKTGACICREGIGGYMCNKCARGFIGPGTNCQPCGECFDNWDFILTNMREDTDRQLARAGEIKTVGATGAYSKEFDEMQASLDEIELLMQSADNINLTSIQEQSDKLRETIQDLEKVQVRELSEELAKVAEGNKLLNIRLQDLVDDMEEIKLQADDLKRNGTAIQETNVQGALNLVEQAKIKAETAAAEAALSENDIRYAERQCKATENLIQNFKADFSSKQPDMRNRIKNVVDAHKAQVARLPKLNSLVCDKMGDPCDEVCGGAGCGVCGGSISCENGATSMAEAALILANDTENILKEKESIANDFLRNLTAINTVLSKNKAQEAYEKTLEAYAQSSAVAANVTDYKDQINAFLSSASNNLDPGDIDKAAKEVLEMNIKLDPAEIQELADKIRVAVDSLTNIDPIIQETEDDLAKVRELKDRANAAKSQVEVIKETSDDITSALKNSSVIQEAANVNITMLRDVVKDISNVLTEINNKKAQMDSKITETDNHINHLQKRLELLRQNVTSNERIAEALRKSSEHIYNNAEHSLQELGELEEQYSTAIDKLKTRKDDAERRELRANALMDRAFQVTNTISKVKDNAEKINVTPNKNVLIELEDDIDALINRMTEYNNVIQERANHYQVCS